MDGFPKLGPAEISALVAAAAALLSFLHQLRSYRLASQAAFRALEDRTKAIAFWTAWLKAQEAACEGDELKARKAVARNELDALTKIEPLRNPPAFGKLARVLMLHRPVKKRAWLFRAPFFVLVLILIAAGYFGAKDLVQKNLTAPYYYAYAGMMIVGVIVVVAVRLIALLLDGDFGAKVPREAVA